MSAIPASIRSALVGAAQRFAVSSMERSGSPPLYFLDRMAPAGLLDNNLTLVERAATQGLWTQAEDVLRASTQLLQWGQPTDEAKASLHERLRTLRLQLAGHPGAAEAFSGLYCALYSERPA